MFLTKKNIFGYVEANSFEQELASILVLALHFGKFPHFNAGKIDVGLKRLTTIRKNIAKNQIYAIAYRFIIAIKLQI